MNVVTGPFVTAVTSSMKLKNPSDDKESVLKLLTFNAALSCPLIARKRSFQRNTYVFISYLKDLYSICIEKDAKTAIGELQITNLCKLYRLCWNTSGIFIHLFLSFLKQDGVICNSLITNTYFSSSFFFYNESDF